MQIIIITFTLLIAFVEYISSKKIYNPIVVMFIYWAFLIFFASMRLYNLQEISGYAYFVMFLGLFSFYMGYIVSRNYRFKLNSDMNFHSNVEYRLRYRFLYALYIIVIIYLMYNALNIISLLRSGYSMMTLRSFYSNQIGNIDEYNVVLQSAGNVVFNLFVSTPTVYMSISVLVVEIYKGRKDRLLFILTFFMLSLWMITSGGGRSVVFWFIIQLIVGKFVFGKSFKLTHKIKRLIIVFSIILGVLFIYTTTMRKGQSIDILKEMYIYFPVGLKNFDYHIQMFKTNYDYQFGASSFYGFLYPIVFILKQFRILSNYPQWIIDAKYVSFTVLEPNVDIGINMNAYATIFYQPYTDMGLFGVAIFMFMYGIIVTYYYNQSIQSKNIRDCAVFLYFIQKLCFSQVRFYFCQVQQVIALLLIFVAFNKVQTKDDKPYI